MKRSVNFNGMKKWRIVRASDLLATFRFLGMSDEEIKAKLLEMKAEAKKRPTQPAPAPAEEEEER